MPPVARLSSASIRQRRWQYGCVPQDMDRSLARIGIADLLRLAALAADAEAGLFERNPGRSGRYSGRGLGRALCQGAGLHYMNGKNGIKDFDVWSFYAQRADWPFPCPVARNPGLRPRSSAGTQPIRRSTRAGASIFSGVRFRPRPGTDPARVIHDYLAAGRTTSARALAAKAAVLIDPMDRAGEIIWPTDGRTS